MKYETWEMVKMLAENPKLKFKDSLGRICLVDTGELITKPIMDIDETWELIPQEVSFLEAVKAYSEGKTIMCEVDNERYTYINDLLEGMHACLVDKCGGSITSKEILNGKWYVE